MPRLHDLQPSFNAGELSPRLTARTDFEKYKSGVETLENMIPLSEGGSMRRAGTRYIAEVADSTVVGRLKRFEFSVEQAYTLELGDQLMRFYRDQQQITIPNTDASIANGTFDSDVTSWTDVSTGTGSIAWNSLGYMDLISAASGNEGIAEQAPTLTTTSVEHLLKFEVVGPPGNFVRVRVGSATGLSDYLADFDAEVGFHGLSFTPTASPMYIQFENPVESSTMGVDNVSLIDDAPMEIDTFWIESELFNIEGPQSADVLYMYHPDNPTYRLERRGNTTWSLIEVEWEGGPWLSLNLGTTTLAPSATTGNAITVTASSVEGINDDLGFQSSDLYRLVRIDNPASDIEWGWGIITGVTDTLNVTVQVEEDFATTTADTRWRLGAWSSTTGFPAKGTFFQERLYSASTAVEPQTVWASQTDDFNNMIIDSDPITAGKYNGTVEADDSFKFTLSADNVNVIQWLRSTRSVLSIGTAGGEWIPESSGVVLTPADRTVTRQTTHGSANIEPVLVDNAALFVQRAQRKIRQFIFTFESDGFEAFDMNRLARHVLKGGVVEMDFAEEPDSLLWAVREDGVLASMTFRSQEDVVGWARHIMGGSFSTGAPVVESVNVIPGAMGAGQIADSSDRDEVWVIVKRTINSVTKRYIEVIERDYEDGDDQEDCYYSDSLVTYDSTATTSITGLDHLEGETVKVWADGAVHRDLTVSSGAITLDSEASVVQVGLGYTHKMKTLRMEGGNPSGSMVGKKNRIYGITFVVLNSHTIQYGPNENQLTNKDFRVVADEMDSPAPLFTGDSFVEFEGGWERDSRIIIQSDLPAPFTVLAIAPESNLNALK